MLAGREFYITGESWGGVYIPVVSLHLMDLLQQGTASPFYGLGFNFQGFAIGNGAFAWRWDEATSVDFIYFRGITSYNAWNNYKASCLDRDPPGDVLCQLADNEACWHMLGNMNHLYFEAIINGHSDPYNLYQQCYELLEDTQFPFANTYNATSLSSTPLMSQLFPEKGRTSESWAEAKMHMVMQSKASRRRLSISRPDASGTGNGANPTSSPAFGQQLLFNYGSNDESAGYPCMGSDPRLFAAALRARGPPRAGLCAAVE
jgi:hypothetical protein